MVSSDTGESLFFHPHSGLITSAESAFPIVIENVVEKAQHILVGHAN